MSKVITTKSPLFWLIVFAGVILPQLTLGTVARAVITSLVALVVVVGFINARRSDGPAAKQR